MELNEDIQATILLTVDLSTSAKKKDDDTPKALTPTEWGKFASWLKSKELIPSSLMSNDLKDVLQDWSHEKVTFERLDFLLKRGAALAMAAEKWSRAGLWVMGRGDSDYPSKYLQRLGVNAPAVLFGCGYKKLLSLTGLAVVGSRNAGEEDLDFTTKIGSLAAGSGYSVISGAARGVDEHAMLGALEVEGTTVGVLANSLLKTSVSEKYRDHIVNKNLVLISSENPERSFHPIAAMARNKYIYCLSGAALVVHSGQKGGTISGAKENLRNEWVRLWVYRTRDPDAANAQLTKETITRKKNHGEYLPEELNEESFKELFSESVDVMKHNQLPLF